MPPLGVHHATAVPSHLPDCRLCAVISGSGGPAEPWACVPPLDPQSLTDMTSLNLLPRVSPAGTKTELCLHNAQETAAETNHWFSSWQQHPDKKPNLSDRDTESTGKILQGFFRAVAWWENPWLWSPIELRSNTTIEHSPSPPFPSYPPHSSKAASNEVLFHHCPLGGPESLLLAHKSWWCSSLLNPGLVTSSRSLNGPQIPQKLGERYQSGLCFFLKA